MSYDQMDDYDAVVKERDEARATKDLHKERTEKAEYQITVLRDLADIDTEARDKITAERDKLAATLQRVQACECAKGGWHCDLNRALADPIYKSLCGIDGCVEQSLLRMFHGYGECVERRKGERRHGDDCGTLTCGRRKGASDRRKPPSTYPLCRECGKWKQP